MKTILPVLPITLMADAASAHVAGGSHVQHANEHLLLALLLVPLAVYMFRKFIK